MPTSAPAAKPIVTFGIQPSTPNSPDNRGYFGLSSTPGGRYTDYVAVTNYVFQPITVSLHPVDAVNTPEGSFALLPPNSPSPNFAPWIKLPPKDITLNLPPRRTVIVPFNVAVPLTATPGDHVGGIIATLQSYVTSPSGQRIQLLQSVGTRIFIRVSGPLHPGLTVENLRARYSGTANPVGSGKVVLSYSVRNTGNVALGGQQTVWVSGLFGSTTHAKKPPRVDLLLPGSSVPERVTFTGVFPELPMTGHVSISPLIVPGSQQPSSGPYRGTVHFWAVPWTLILSVALIVVGAAAWLITRRRRRKTAKVVETRARKVPPYRATTPSEANQPAGGEDVAPVVAPVATVPEADQGEEPAPIGLSGAAHARNTAANPGKTL